MRLLSCTLLWLLPSFAFAAGYVPGSYALDKLPQEHEYQRQLRSFLATLSEQDFAVEPRPITAQPTDDPERQYRLWLLAQHLPNVSAARLPAASFTLAAIEGKKGLTLPCGNHECQMLAWLAAWDDAGNPYRGSRAVRLRAVVLAAVDMLALDYLYEHEPQGSDRADFLGGNLIWLGYTHLHCRDVLPAEARAAFDAGLKKLVTTINRWGPYGAMTDMDLFAPVGLSYVAAATKDPDVRRIAEEYSRRLFTEPRFFHPAGYFVDNGCFDTSYNGISLYFGTWAALQNDWPFARDAIDRSYRLRGLLSFPHPDGTFSGPSAMASRCSGDPPRDQWQFPPRTLGSGMVTDEALSIAPLPPATVLANAPASVAGQLNRQLESPRAATAGPWREHHWSGALNFAYEFYRPGYYTRRVALAKEDSPLLKPRYARDETFVRDFGGAFVIGRNKRFAAAIHTGPVAGIHREWQRPYGFGGGELSAFWTPATGPVLLARRRGVQGHVFDRFDEWRSWPVHAVTGLAADGGIVSSSRIERPEVESRCTDDTADVRVAGQVPKYVSEKQGMVPADLKYERRFRLDAKGLRVTTTVSGSERLSELYETIPVFLRESSTQPAPAIRFRVSGAADGALVEAETAPREKVEAIELTRYDGAVTITFARPVTARLSPLWRDGFQTQAECRTVLIDLRPDVAVEYTFAVP